MREAAETWRYAAALSVLVVAEWLYIDWASRAPLPLLDNFVHAEWRRRRSLQALENVHVRSVCVGRSEEGEFEGDSPKEEVAAQIRLPPHTAPQPIARAVADPFVSRAPVSGPTGR
jgi:hypothetical protein